MQLPRRLQPVVMMTVVLLATPMLSWAAASHGGTDVVAHEFTPATAFGADMDIASNGDIYAVNKFATMTNSEISVWRSQDGGESWSLWGSFSLPSGDGTGDPTICIAEGDADRVFVAYRRFGDIWVARADLHAATPVFSHQIALDSPDDLVKGRIVSDAADYSAYFLYIVAGESTLPADVYFARSTNMGDSWDTEYIIGPANGPEDAYAEPQLSYSRSVLHCVMSFTDVNAPYPDSRLRYRRMVNFGANGLADWSTATDVTTGADNLRHGSIEIASSEVSSKVIIAATTDSLGVSSPDPFALVRSSSDAGLTWPGANEARIPDCLVSGSVALPSGGFGLATVSTYPYKARVSRATDGNPLFWTTTQLSDRDDGQVFVQVPRIDYDLTRGEQIGMTWFHQDTSPSDSIMFDAEWRAATGFPSVAAGFPVALGSAVVVAPALATLDDDSELEILVGTADGMLHAYNPDGTPVPGWPVNVGTWPTSTPRNGTIAAGDLNGDGRVEVVAGSGGGEVAVFRNDGSPAPGWPLPVSNSPVFVSIGRITEAARRNVVVCTNGNLYVYEPDGSLVTGFPVALSGTIPGPAAIGDLDGDGDNEMVVATGTHVDVVSKTGSILLSKLLSPGDAASAQPSLADMDLDGDLEIAAPTYVGRVHLFDYPGGADLPGWPITTPLGGPISAIAIANNSGTLNPELIFAEQDSTLYMYHYNGALNSNWPKHTGYGWNLYGAPTIDFVEDIISSDVLIGSRDSKGHAFRNTTGVVPGWPRLLGDQVEVAAASGDIDFDGNLEVVFGGLNDLWVLDVNQTVSRDQPNEIWPMFAYNAQRTSCLACEPDVVVGVEPSQPLPAELSFAPPMPNPTSGSQVFRFALATEAQVQITVYDAHGRVVRVALNRAMRAGRHSFEWDGRDGSGRPLPAGVYFARLQTSSAGVAASRTQRLVVLR